MEGSWIRLSSSSGLQRKKVMRTGDVHKESAGYTIDRH